MSESEFKEPNPTESVPEPRHELTEPDQTGEMPANNWSDIFYGVLMAPKETLSILCDEHKFRADKDALAGALAITFLAFAVEGLNCGDNTVASHWPVALSMSLIQAGVAWVSLAGILYLLSGWISGTPISYKNALVGCGWGFLPLIFSAPMACLSLGVSFLGGLLTAIPSLWMYYLQFLVFSRGLHVRRRILLLWVVVGLPLLGTTVAGWLLIFSLFMVRSLLRTVS